MVARLTVSRLVRAPGSSLIQQLQALLEPIGNVPPAEAEAAFSAVMEKPAALAA